MKMFIRLIILTVVLSSIPARAGIFDKLCRLLIGGGIEEKNEPPDMLLAERAAKKHLNQKIKADENGIIIEWLKTELVEFSPYTVIRTHRVHLFIPKLKKKIAYDITVDLHFRPATIISLQEVPKN